MRALALQFVAPRKLALVERALDEPARDEILVRTLYSGISSGTELLAYRGEIDPDTPLDDTIGALGGTFSYPFHYGYACVGVVESSSGDLGAGTLAFAFHPHQDRFVCATRDAIVLGDVDARVATMFPLVEIALQITLDAAPSLGDTVVVTGLGCVGTLAALLLQRAGARVVGVDPSSARRALAAELDVEAVAPENARARAADAPLVVEASGNPAALAQALPLLAHEGTALVASWYGTKPATLALGAEFHRRRLTIRSVQVSTIPARMADRWTVERRRAHAVRLLGELPLKRLATHVYPFARAADAFDALDRGDDRAMHVALSYGER
ncbi:MAG TPA: zinc-binding alcohol dehydrogenase [Actinomycetota bacterium]|nr:zinc-binding alcohol dehydrogenase [Actinomycetota bacterium]